MSAQTFTSGVTIGRYASVHDARDVHLSFIDAPDVRTPAGKLPIKPTSARLHYSIPDGRLWSVTIVGDPTDPADRERRTQWSYRGGERKGYVSNVTRRIAADALPPWLEEIAEQYRPTYTSGDAS